MPWTTPNSKNSRDHPPSSPPSDLVRTPFFLILIPESRHILYRKKSNLLYGLIWALLLLLFSGAGFAVHAQKVEVSGVVLDAETQEVLPLVGVVMEGTSFGINTNLDGEFVLYVPPGEYVLMVRYSGYDLYRDSIVVPKEGLKRQKVLLAPKSMSLDDVLITSKAVNPAHRIIRNAIKNRKKNRFDKIDSYEYESYNKLVVYADNVSKEFLDSKLIRGVGREVQDILGDSSYSDSAKYKIAAFVSESVSRFYYARPDKKKEEILAVKTSGVKGSEYNLLSSMFLQLDVYDNNVVIVDRTFLSPIADGAFVDYDYHLINVESYGSDTLFGIEVLPKRSYDPVFKGVVYIDNHDWALNRIDLKLNDNPNINFVEDIRLRQEYSKVDTHWVPTLLDVEVDFQNSLMKRKGGKNLGAIGRTSAYLYDYRINQPREEGFFNEELLEIKEDAEEHDSTFWAEKRRSPLDKGEQLGYALVDSLQSRGVLDLYIETVYLLTVGRKKFKKWELGPYFYLGGFNQAEGFRTRIGAYTRPNFSKRWYLGGHVAYGFRDRRVKYQGEVRYRIKRKPKFEVGLRKTYEVEQAGFENFLNNGTGLLQTALRRVPLTQLNYYHEHKLDIHRDMRRGLSGDFYFRHKTFEPASTFNFGFEREDGGLGSDYEVAEVGGEIRVSFKENYITSKRGDRLYLGTKYPIFYLRYARGFTGFAGSDYDYHKASITMRNLFRLGRYGWLRYKVEAGQVFGTLPYPSLFVFEGNQTWGYSKFGFNMMNYYEFVADRYATIVLQQHFEGLLWNKLPLLRKLKWKEAVHLRAAWGTLSPDNQALNNVDVPTEDGVFEQRIKAPTTEPYLEAGAGLYNIFKVFRVDAIWRLNYHDLRWQTDPSIPKSNWGPRNNFGLRFDLTLTF